MNHPFRQLVLCTAGAVAVGMVNSSAATASDFGPMALGALYFVIIVAGVALLLGAATAAILVRVYRRKSVWVLVPLFAVGWFFLIFSAVELWGDSKPPHVAEPGTPELIVPFTQPAREQ